MIYCLLIQVSRNQQGESIRKEGIVSGDAIQIGSDAARKIRLFDDQVAPLHATIKQSKEGALYLESEGEANFRIDGGIKQNALLLPGARVEIGPYLLTVDPASTGSNIALSVEALPPAPGQGEETVRNEPLSIAELRISKRKWAFALAALIVLLFLLLPLLPSISSGLDKKQATLPVTLTDAWNPGQLAAGHSAFAAQCSVCHSRAFGAVPDEACTACHKKVEKHLKDDAQHASLFQDSRCTDCHVDHQGEHGLMQHSSPRCVACHGDIKSTVAKSSVSNVHDFATDHPPFRLTLQNAKKGRPAIRVRQNQNQTVVEKNGLKFSHQVHLDKNGISTPGGDIVMKCADCHQLDESGNHFTPMTMAKSCQQAGCHSLDFMPPVEGVVPHGSEREAMNRIREYFTKWVVDGNQPDCDRAVGNSLQKALSCADKLARENAATSLFVSDAGCGECHELSATGDLDVPWKVAPLNLNRNWFSKSVFPHARHGTVDCTACHDKMNSKKSADISMPDIAKCRECHAGEHPVKGKISTTCSTCHRFHGGGDAAKAQ
jgi:hypothetical protein